MVIAGERTGIGRENKNLRGDSIIGIGAAGEAGWSARESLGKSRLGPKALTLTRQPYISNQSNGGEQSRNVILSMVLLNILVLWTNTTTDIPLETACTSRHQVGIEPIKRSASFQVDRPSNPADRGSTWPLALRIGQRTSPC